MNTCSCIALQSLDLLELGNLTWEDLSVPTQDLLQFQVGFQSLSHHWVSATYIIAYFPLHHVSLPPAAYKSDACMHHHVCNAHS